MDIQTQRSAATYGSSYGTSTSTSNGLDKDMFLQLLAAQLQYQDPMESVDSSQMVLQMAQYANIEAMSNLNDQFAYFLDMSSMSIGASMVGKEVMVSVETEEGGSITKTGIVEQVGFTSSGPILQIDGDYHEMWRVVTISNGEKQVSGTPEVVEIPEAKEAVA